MHICQVDIFGRGDLEYALSKAAGVGEGPPLV
jgi:hypothetical protein